MEHFPKGLCHIFMRERKKKHLVHSKENYEGDWTNHHIEEGPITEVVGNSSRLLIGVRQD